MSRLQTLPITEATGQTAELFAAIKGAVGKVPNAYAVIGSNAPALLAQALAHNAALKKGSLNAKQLEAINLAVSEVSGCDYCLAAHTLAAKGAGFSAEQIQALRHGIYQDDAAIDALITFVRDLVASSGTLAASKVEALKTAGYSDRQIVEAISAISAILFTNMINRVNDTVLDFPKVN